MKFFAIYMKTEAEKPLETMQCVNQKFAFMAGIFQGFWALYHRMWSIACFLIFLEVALAIARTQSLIGEITLAVINLAIFFYVGCSASDWRELYLKNKGYQLMNIVIARDEMEAQQRYMEQQLSKPARTIAENPFKTEAVI